MHRLFATTVLLLASFATHAGCQCSCVGGLPQPVCSSPLDVKPICANRACPPAPPSLAPPIEPRVPPVGASKCVQKQVLNEKTGRYEWKEICS